MTGFDTFPTFKSYYAPGRTTFVGAAVPKTKGNPGWNLNTDFVVCQVRSSDRQRSLE
jgi:hypothetical protein